MLQIQLHAAVGHITLSGNWIGLPPAIFPRSSSEISMEPAGFGGRLALSAALSELRNAASFQARMMFVRVMIDQLSMKILWIPFHIRSSEFPGEISPDPQKIERLSAFVTVKDRPHETIRSSAARFSFGFKQEPARPFLCKPK